jgi:NitT/TauT family transport system ATP-binding protein
MLELLADRGGRDGIRGLAKLLQMEIDDILPIIDAAVLLGFMAVAQGEVETTARGREFVAGGIEERKKLFREAALESVPLLRQVESSLRLKTDHALPDEFFHDILDEHVGEEEAERQLSTAIHWARYAEIFDHDADRRRLVLTEP